MNTLFRLSVATALVWAVGCEGPSSTSGPSASTSTQGQGVEQPSNEFNPLPQGFEWAMAERFPIDRDGDGVRDGLEDAAYARPESFEVTLEGCPAWSSPDFTYEWQIKGERSVVDLWQVTHLDRGCRFTSVFPGQGTYEVALTIRSDSGSRRYVQRVTLKDWLIVGMGDSYGSGEGSPDIPGNYPSNQAAKWADQRCHRSFKSASALVAQQLEESDPHSSVTYISLACSGANISQNSYEGISWISAINPLPDPDDEAYWTSRGQGLLGSYIGIETPHPGPWNTSEMLPPQVDRLKEVVGNRRIDALLLSAGGNDAGFSNVLAHCTMTSTCHADLDGHRLTNFTQKRFTALPNRFATLGARLSQLFGNIDVYLTEYPDLSRDQNGEACVEILHNVAAELADGIRRSQGEVQWIQNNFLAPLNQELRNAVQVQRQQQRAWHYVGGIEAAFRNHGMCAGDDRWFRVPPESRDLQGPKDDKRNTTGTAHPNEEGYRQLARAIRTQLFKTLGGHPYYPDGTLLREEHSGAIYVTQGFGRFPVPDEAALQELMGRLGTTGASIKNLTSVKMSEVPTAPRDGTFTRSASGNIRVYYGGAPFHVPNMSDLNRLLALHGLDHAAVGPIPSNAHGLLSSVPRDGTVVRDGVNVYYIYSGAIMPVSSVQQQRELGITDGHINPLPAGALSTLLNIPSWTSHLPVRLAPLDSVFVRGGTDTSVMIGGAAHHVADPQELSDLGTAQGRPGAPVHALPAYSYDRLPKRPHDNVLIQELTTGAVSVIQGGTAFHIGTWPVVEAIQAELSPEARTLHPAPRGLKDRLPATPLNHTLLREVNAPEVYLMMGGRKYHMPTLETIRRMGLDPARIRVVPPGALARFPTGPRRLDAFVDEINATTGVVRGWSLDLDSPSNVLQLTFMVDGPTGVGEVIGSMTTQRERPDVNAAYRDWEAAGTHGFTFTLPNSVRTGTPRELYVIARDAQGDETLTLGPIPFQL